MGTYSPEGVCHFGMCPAYGKWELQQYDSGIPESVIEDGPGFDITERCADSEGCIFDVSPEAVRQISEREKIAGGAQNA
jgi:hypothetical protein